MVFILTFNIKIIYSRIWNIVLIKYIYICRDTEDTYLPLAEINHMGHGADA